MYRTYHGFQELGLAHRRARGTGRPAIFRDMQRHGSGDIAVSQVDCKGMSKDSKEHIA